MMNLGCESQPFSNIADFEGSTAVKKSNFATFREEFNMTEHITRWGFDSWRFKKLMQRLPGTRKEFGNTVFSTKMFTKI